MLFFTKGKDLKNLIIYRLKHGAMKTDVLLKAVRQSVPTATKQAFYLALRQLLKEEAVVKHGKEVAINLLFVDRLQVFLDDINKNYITQSKTGMQSLLSGTDRLIYQFNNLFSLDNYLLHIFSLIISEAPVPSPLYLYNPFEWFLLAKPKVELSYYDWLIKKGKTIFLVLGENAPLNKLVAKKYSNKDLVIAIDDKLRFKENEFVTVLNDYIIISKIAMATAIAINNLCRDNSLSPTVLETKVSELLSGKLRAKITIVKNHQKAEKYKKLLARQFFIPKDLRAL
ncbi:MAG: hypothetical protein UT42_C0004G0008 [Candidatus Falkowbacteria bacterium GW2011_GWA2_39_24]|uniref:Uncharacterized protein n=1 Tax=Candidatus Falkowbacteria bacterium GW2011_GWA2_39_24 TaxID=1618634 RepID=A0A0G0RNZ8_9BACT|nr:MAG: hypothetical protein UT42_C0004G0008 [Candidatus Falkowbacteria bacterium GW2011_GWA2_39_24]